MNKNESSCEKPYNELIFDFEAVFDPDNYLYFYEDALTEERTLKEVDFLVRELALHSPKRILDLACGHGRHANRLAELGHSVVGVDNNRRFLDLARQDAQNKGLGAEYVQCDMREIGFRKEFDVVLLLFTSFGYFSDAENQKVLSNVQTALKPGGLFCFDIMNRDAFLKELLPQTFVLGILAFQVWESGTFFPLIEEVMNLRAHEHVGFDLHASPFANLLTPAGWSDAPGIPLGKVARGYVYLGPKSSLHKNTSIEGFVTGEMFKRYKRYYEIDFGRSFRSGKEVDEYLQAHRFPDPQTSKREQ